jgi:peptide-methionine (S)-S-oxide reductase
MVNHASRRSFRKLLWLLPVGALAAPLVALAISHSPAAAESAVVPLPAPQVDMPAGGAGLQTAILSGGCFWGIQGVFAHVNGVKQVAAGYDGGSASTAQYELVSTGATGHAESVKIVFDPSQVSYGTLLRIFFTVALDPTQVDAQYPDSGTQYRSELFTTTPEQAHVATAYIAQLNAAKVFHRPIATRVDPDHGFFAAEAYHQNYLTLHPDSPYIATFDLPKVAALRQGFPESYRQDPVLFEAASAKGGPTGGAVSETE